MSAFASAINQVRPSGSQRPVGTSIAEQGVALPPTDDQLTPSQTNAAFRNSINSLRNELQAAPDPLGPDAASGSANIGRPLGELVQGIADIPSQVGQQFNRIGDISFMSEAGIGARANQLLMDKISAFEGASGTSIGAGGEDQRLIQQFSEEARAEAQATGDAANQEAFGFTVGMRAAQEAFNIAATHRAVKDQLNQIQRDTERFINGVEFNSMLQKNAQDVVAMKNNLRTIDSILHQTGPIQAGKQQQAFVRNPVTGNLLTEL